MGYESYSSPCQTSDTASSPDAFVDAPSHLGAASPALAPQQPQGPVPSGLAASASASSSSSSSAPVDFGAFLLNFQNAGRQNWTRSSAPSSLALPSMTLPPTPRGGAVDITQASDSSDVGTSNPWKIDVRRYFDDKSVVTPQGSHPEAVTGLGIDATTSQRQAPSTSASELVREGTSSSTARRPLSPSSASFLKAHPHADEFFTSPAFSNGASTSLHDHADIVPSPALTTIEEETQERPRDVDATDNYSYSFASSPACLQSTPAASTDGMMTIRSGGLGLYFPSALLEEPSAAIPASNFEMDLDLEVDLDCPLPACTERRPSLVDLIGHLVAHVATPQDQAGLSQTGVQ